MIIKVEYQTIGAAIAALDQIRKLLQPEDSFYAASLRAAQDLREASGLADQFEKESA
jgi:hypothetical protein